MSRTYKTEGIVLKRINWGEADKILTIFSKHYGKIRCIAKGIRKLTSRKGGNLELFNYVVVFLIKTKGLEIISEVQVINSFPAFRKDLKRIALAYHLCELIDCFSRENQTNKQLLLLLKESFEYLSRTNENLPQLLFNFKIKLLDVTGFGLPKQVNEQILDKYIESIIEKRVKCFYE